MGTPSPRILPHHVYKYREWVLSHHVYKYREWVLSHHVYEYREWVLPHHVYKYRACPPSPPPNQTEFVPWLPTFSFKVVHFVAHLSLTCIISEES